MARGDARTRGATRRRIAIAASAAFLAVIGLAACASPEEIIGGLVQEGIERGVEGITGAGALPADFPAEVPVAEGDIQFAVGLPGSEGKPGWNVTVRSAATAADVRAQLEAAGFTPAAGDELGAGPVGTIVMENATFHVLAVVAEDPVEPGTTIVNYTVTTK